MLGRERLYTADVERGRWRMPSRLIAWLLSQEPLPESAEEICDIGELYGATNDDVFLGERATEAAVKALDRSGTLQEYDVVHFSTHAFVTKDFPTKVPGLVEPAILLTPPHSESTEDDGLLTVSEIERLHLKADWVLLSACNTASGDRGDPHESEGLSGLARAFLGAGARSLAVSHWPVDAKASVVLMKAMVGGTVEPGANRRSQALRRAIGAMLAHPDARAAHPWAWGPFSVVSPY